MEPVRTRARTPVSSRLYEPTAASRSRAAANAQTIQNLNDNSNDHHQFNTSQQSQQYQPSSIYQQLHGATSTQKGRPSRAGSPSASTRPLAAVGGGGMNSQKSTTLSSHHASSSALTGGTRRTPVRAHSSSNVGGTEESETRGRAAGVRESSVGTSTVRTRTSVGVATGGQSRSTGFSTPLRARRQSQHVQNMKAEVSALPHGHFDPNEFNGILEEKEVLMSPSVDREALAMRRAASPSLARPTGRGPSLPYDDSVATTPSASPTRRVQSRTVKPIVATEGIRIVRATSPTASSRTTASHSRAGSVTVPMRAKTKSLQRPTTDSNGTSTNRSGTTPTRVGRGATRSLEQPNADKNNTSTNNSSNPIEMEMSPMGGADNFSSSFHEPSVGNGSTLTDASALFLLTDEPQFALTIESLVFEEENARTDILVAEELKLWECYTSLLADHCSAIDAKIANVHLIEETRKKRVLCEELKAKTAAANEEMLHLKKEIETIKAEAKETKRLEEKLNALNNFSKINDAKMRQKQATMEFLQNTTKELADSCDLLIAKLYLEVEELADLSERCSERHSFSESFNGCRPLECMAVLAETDFMREIYFEDLVAKAEDTVDFAAGMNGEMKATIANGTAQLIQTEEMYEQKKVEIRKELSTDRRRMERDMKVLKKEIADLNFQIRRGTNIKSLSQLPIHGNHQIEKNKARELFLDVEAQRIELEKLRGEEKALRERVLALREYHGNKEEECHAVATRAIRERTELDAIKDNLREEIVCLQRKALTYQGFGQPAGSNPPSNKALADIDEDSPSSSSRQDAAAGGRITEAHGGDRSSEPATIDESFSNRVLTAEEALRILDALEAEGKARAQRRAMGHEGYSNENSAEDCHMATPASQLRGRSGTPSRARGAPAGGGSLLDRLCRPTKGFASYVDARVMEDNARRSVAVHMREARPDARPQ